MDDRQRVKDYIKKHGVRSPERIRGALSKQPGGPIRTAVIREVLAGVSGQPLPAQASPSPAAVRTRTLGEFRRQHDYALKLKQAITELRDGYVTEHEMKAAAGVPNHLWRRFADLPEFQENRLKLRDVTYWARKPVIQEMREIVGAI